MILVILTFMHYLRFKVKVIGVPYTPTGPDLEAFKEAIETYNPRLYITNSGIHNPTGAVLSLSTAHQLLKLIEQSNLIVVEDDIFSDFEYSPAPRLAALDNLFSCNLYWKFF